MVRWIMITDLHFGMDLPNFKDNDEFAAKLIEQAALEDPAFVVNAGDCISGGVADGRAEERNVKKYWSLYHRAMRPLTDICPVITVMGNHDQTGDAATSENFCQETGRDGKPPYFSKTINGIHIVAIDTLPRRHHGGFPDRTRQARWLRRDLKRSRNAKATIVCGHYPVFVQPILYDIADSSLFYNEKTREEGVLLPMLMDGDVDMYLCGHNHIYQRLRYGRLTQIMAGATTNTYDGMIKHAPCKYIQVFDRRQSYVRFTVTDKSIRGEAVALGGDIIDTWTQRLNKRSGGS